MKFLKLVIICAFFTHTHGQNNSHNLFGLNMDLDWYSLTNYSGLSYAIADNDASIDYVVTDCDFYFDKVDAELEGFGFNDYFIAFPKGAEANKSGLETLLPLLFMGFYDYTDLSSFNSQAFNDAVFLKDKLSQLYGSPSLKIEKEEFRVYQWEVDDVTIIVNSVKSELMTALNFMVNSR